MSNKIESIECFVSEVGIDTNKTDVEVYGQYKSSTKYPHTKTMFTRYLRNEKGYSKTREMVDGVRNFYYRPTKT